MSREFKTEVPLVYYISDGSSRLFNYADILKNDGFEVHCFDNQIAALECCEESRFPDAVIATPFSTTIDTWQFICLLRQLAIRREKNIPVLMLMDSVVDIPTIARSTGIPVANILVDPIERKEFLKRVRQSIGEPFPPGKSILVFADEKLFANAHQTRLTDTGFNVIRVPDLVTIDRDVLSDITMILIGATKLDKTLKQGLRNITRLMPDVPITVMGDHLSTKLAAELTGIGSTIVIMDSCSPGELCRRCHEAVSLFLFRRWSYQNNLIKKEYQDRELLYRRVVESQNDLLCKWQADMTLTYVNTAFCQMLKTSRKNLVGKAFPLVIVPDSKTSIETITQEIIRIGRVLTFENGYIDQSGHTRWHHWTCSPIPSGEGLPVEVLAVGRDISELKKLEMDLAHNNAELQSLVATIPNHLWYLSDPDTYRSANQTHADFLGVQISDLTDRSIGKIYGKGDIEPWRKIADDVMQTRKPVSAERMLTSGSGERRLLAVNETPCLDENGNVRFIVCLARDVTEERMREFNLAFKAEFEHLISRISSEFVQADASVSERVITGSLEKIVHFTNIDRAYICLEEDQNFTGIPQFSWRTDMAFPLVRGIHQDHSWFMNMLMELRPVHIPDTTDIPKEAVQETEYCRINQIKSLLVIPIERNRKLAGYIVMEAIHAHVTWEPDIQALLKFYGEIFLTTLLKTRAWNFIESERDFGVAVNLAESLEDLLTICLDYVIAISDMDSGGIYIVNDLDNSLELIKHKNLSQNFIDANRSFQEISPNFTAISEGHPIYVTHEKIMTPSRKRMLEEGLTSFAIYPVTFENRIIASVNIASRTRKQMSDFAKAAIETVVSRLGSLIAKARMDEAIRRNWTNLDTLFNSMKDYLFAVDDQGYIRHSNMICQTSLGYQTEDIRGMQIRNLYPREFGEIITSRILSETSSSVAAGDAQLVTADGKWIPVDVRLVRGEWQGSPVWFVFNHDVRELKEAENRRIQLERHVQQAQKIESLSRMAGAIAHRFNNLLMGIIGNLELIRMQTDPGDKMLDKIGQAENAAQRATDLGRLMLTYVGQVGTNRVNCDLTDVTQRVMPLLTASAPSGTKFETEFVDDLPMISADVSGLHQIIMNLASNSWESFESNGGLIHLETGFMDVTEDFDDALVDNETLSPGEYVYFAITDNGSGMDKETVDRMFDPFFSTKFTGRGLGLSTVLGIVRAHEGAISVISEKGISTRVTVWFPALKEKRMALQSVFGQDIPESYVSKTVLLADDEDDVREVARQMLEKLGYTVITASDGDEAVRVFEANQASLDYVICDIKMPGRDGWDTMNAIRKIRPDVPFFLVTGYGLTAGEMENRPKPDGIIQKPYRFQNLLKALNRT